MRSWSCLGLGTQRLGLGLGLEKKVLFTPLIFGTLQECDIIGISVNYKFAARADELYALEMTLPLATK